MSVEKFIKPGSKVERALQFERAAVNEESRTVELAFASGWESRP